MFSEILSTPALVGVCATLVCLAFTAMSLHLKRKERRWRELAKQRELNELHTLTKWIVSSGEYVQRQRLNEFDAETLARTIVRRASLSAKHLTRV